MLIGASRAIASRIRGIGHEGDSTGMFSNAVFRGGGAFGRRSGAGRLPLGTVGTRLSETMPRSRAEHKHGKGVYSLLNRRYVRTVEIGEFLGNTGVRWEVV